MTSFAAGFVRSVLWGPRWRITALAVFVRHIPDFRDDIVTCWAYNMEGVVPKLNRHVFHFQDYYFF